jgi:hypothetical protein
MTTLLSRHRAAALGRRAAALALSATAMATATATTAVALSLGPSASVFAQPVGDPGGAGRPTPAQWQKIFPEHRQLMLQDHRARVAILQRGERCIAAAGNEDVMRACLRDERSAMQQQRRQHMDAVRVLFERNGMPVPEWKNRRGGPGGGPGWRGTDV